VKDIVHPVAVRSVSVGGDATRVVTASDDKIVRLWDLASGLELERFAGHEANVASVSLAADNKTILSGSADKSGRLWTAAAVRVVQADPAKVNDLVLSADGAQAITVGDDKVAKVWNTTDGAAVRQIAGAQANLVRLAIRPDGVQVAGADAQGRVYLWTYANGALAQTIETGSPVIDLAFSIDNQRIVAVSADNKLRVYDATAAEITPLGELASPTPVAAIAFAPDKTIITGGTDKQIAVWADVSPNAVRSLAGHTAPVYDVAFSPDGKLVASASGDQTIRIWDATTGAQVRAISGSVGPVYAIDFNADGTQLVSGGADGLLRLWNVANGEQLKQLSEGEKPSPLFGVAFSADGRFAAGAGAEKVIRIWDANSGAVAKNLVGHTDAVYQVAFNPPGTRLLSCGRAGNLTVWNIGDGKPAFTGKSPNVLYSGTYARDGSAIAVAEATGSTVFVAVPQAAR
jgi:WD40 repeat protein